jgi:two-component system OmpR family sensor kinase
VKSIKRAILSGLTIGIIVCSSTVLLFLFLAIREEIFEIMDYQMEQVALAAHLRRDYSTPETASGFEEETVDSIVQIRDAENNLLYTTNREIAIPFVSKPGFSDLTFDGTPWRVYVLSKEDTTVQVAQPLKERKEIVLFIAMETALSLLALAVALAIWIYIVVNRSFRPVQKLCDSIRRKKASRLDPVDETMVPEEILPLARELNALLSRLDIAIKGQKQFLADAAHELRTPLTAVDLQVQNALDTENELERENSLKKMKKGINRATGMVNQLLMMAKTDADDLEENIEVLDFRAIIGDVVSEFSPLAMERGIDLQWSKPEAPILLAGNVMGLKAMISSLVDNALKYSPSGTTVTLNAFTGAEKLFFEINDEGPGIPPEQKPKVFRRFYRHRGERTLGSGLGLAIAKNIIDVHKGSITLEDGDNGRGLKVKLVLPLFTENQH